MNVHEISNITPQTDKVYGACEENTTKDKFNYNRKIVCEAPFKVDSLKEDSPVAHLQRYATGHRRRFEFVILACVQMQR